VEVIEGDWFPKRLVVLRFPDLARAKAWLNSAEYAPALAIRRRAAKSHMIFVEGVSEAT
jgi:uncharacterized protein (DUF1330 family)